MNRSPIILTVCAAVCLCACTSRSLDHASGHTSARGAATGELGALSGAPGVEAPVPVDSAAKAGAPSGAEIDAMVGGPTARQLLRANEMREAGELQRLRWNDAGGAPRAAWGRLDEPLGDEPRAAARTFVERHALLLGMEGSVVHQGPDGVEVPVDVTLEPTHVYERRGVAHVRLQRFQDGVPLRGEEMLLHLGPGGAPIGFNASLPRAMGRAAPEPRLTSEDAIARASAEQPDVLSTTARLVYLERELGGTLAWEVIVVPRRTGAATRYDVDAAFGSIVASEVMAPMVTDQATAQATGHVTSCAFEEKPSLGGWEDVPLGALWVDADGEQRLTAADGSYAAGATNSFVLAGPVCDVMPVEGSRVSYAGGANAEVCFGYFDARFAESSAFYHTNEAATLFSQRYGFDTAIQLAVYVNDTEEHFNAHYWNNQLWFGKGQGIFPMSSSFDVVTHEFGHFVSHHVANGGNGLWYNQYTQTGAISEGYSDYFPASYRDDPRFNDAFQPWFGRPLDNDRVYPDDYNAESHNGGIIWGGLLWDIREALGADVADFIAFDAIAFLPAQPDFLDGRDALLAAELILYGGAHAATVLDLAEARGFVDARTVYARSTDYWGWAPLETELVGGYSGFYGDDVTTTWEFGDGQSVEGTHVAHTYARGKYNARFIVNDSEGSLSETATLRSCQSTGAAPVWVTLAMAAVAAARRRRHRVPAP